MSDYYNNNYKGYGRPQQPPQPPQQPPQAPQQPPQAPQQPPQAPQQAPQAPQQPPQALQQPPQAPQQPSHNTYYNGYPQQPAPPQAPSYYNNVNNVPPAAPPQAPVKTAPIPPQAPGYPDDSPYTSSRIPQKPVQPANTASPYAPPKQPMSAGLKALIIIIVTILFVSLFGFIAYVSLTSNKSTGFVPETETTTETETATSTKGFSFGDNSEETTEASTGNYKNSDSKDKKNKNYKGLKLEKKPKKTKSDKTGSSYAFSKIENSVVGLIVYVDGQKGTTESYTNMGTGIVISADGYIVTNAHLVEYSRTAYKYKVITNDKKEFKAGVVGYDSRSDLAVLKVDAKGLVPATFGDSSEIKVTEDVIVVGNPLSLNFQNSVTKGIVSAVERKVSITNNVKLIQTDAAINPGNSGGPLCNMYGQVIGVTNSKIALDNYEGMGFAIPSKTVKTIVDDIIRYSYVRNRVKIGVLGKVNYVDSSGKTAIQIQEITKNGPMDGTEAKAGDFITKFDGKTVANFSDIYDLLEKHKAGDKVKITIYRPSEDKTYEFTITLEADNS